VKWSQRKTGRRVSHLVFTFGEKVDKQPKTVVSQKRPSKPENSVKGALYGIPRAVIEANARPGEEYENAALRLLNEARAKRTSDMLGEA
jgi:hypothetical protein